MTRHTAPHRVLIVDDDLMSREVLTLLLSSAGFEVESVLSGDAAIHHLGSTATNAPAIILVDMQMPGLTGPALAAALRRICPAPTVIFAMSGSTPQPSELVAFDSFLLKPFRAHQLMDLLEEQSHTKVLFASAETLSTETPLDVPAASNPTMSMHSAATAPAPYPTHSASKETTRPALDERIYKQLQEAMPGKQLVQMYNLCVDDVRKRISDMRSLATRHDADQFQRQAHAIKGGCGMLGASELYTMASKLEKAGLTAAGLDGAHGVNPLDELTAACDRLERILGTRT